jgi:hypothetical protein
MDARTGWHRHDGSMQKGAALAASAVRDFARVALGPLEVWGLWASCPWRPLPRHRPDRWVLAATLGLNGLLAASFLRLGFPTLSLGLDTGAGMCLAVLSGGAAGLVPWVVGELDGRAERADVEALAVSTSCALAVAAWAAGIHLWVALPALGLLGAFGLVNGLAGLVGWTRLRAAAAVYLAFQVGTLGLVAGAWILLHFGLH